MRKHHKYKHVNNTDVAIEVVRFIYISEKLGYKVKVNWLNIVNRDNIYPCDVTEEIFIKKENIKDWIFYD